MKGIFTLLFLLLHFYSICDNCYGQKQEHAKIDSLLRELPKANADTNKVKLLNDLSYYYAYVNHDKGLNYGRQALALATDLGWEAGIAGAYGAIGGNYENASDYANALKYEYEALKRYQSSGDKKKEATMLGNIGIVYRTYGDKAKALEYDSAALVKFEAAGDMPGKAMMLGNIGNIYDNEGRYSKALEQYFSALEINRSLGMTQREATNLGNIGNAYADDGKPSIALRYYFEGLRIDSSAGNKDATTRDMGNIGETYLDIARDTTGRIRPDSLVPGGKQANLDKATAYLREAVRLAKDVNRPAYLEEYAQSLSEAYFLSGNCADAFSVYKEYIVVRDSLSNLEKDKAFARHELDYEYGKREAQIRYQEKLDTERYVAGIAGLLLISFFLYRNFRTQKKLNGVISKEKKRSEDLLLNILPAEVAEELKDKGSAAAKLFDHVTVLFTDFVGFTKMTERLTPQELIDELDACFKAFDGIIDKHGIEKIKTIGDAYLAVSGLPVADPAHAVKVVLAAIEINTFIKQRVQQMGDKAFDVRIGIHSGSVVAGIVGVKKFAYDIWGDTVNTAARLEQSSEAGKINISQDTYDLVKDNFHCTYRGEVEAKNKGKLRMYFVDS